MVHAAQAQHAEQLASHTRAYIELYNIDINDIVDAGKQLDQQAERMACLQTQLTQIQLLHFLLFATPFSLSCVLTMLPCRHLC